MGKVGSGGCHFLDGKDDVVHSSSLLGLSIVGSGSVNVVDGIGVGWFVDIIVLSNC